MSRSVGVVLLGAVITAVLAACSSTPVDPDDINDWRAAQEAASSRDASVVTALSANVSAGQHESAESGEIRVDFDEAVTVKRIEFSCFGDGSMRAAGAAQAGSSSFAAGLDTLDCEQSPHEIDVSLFGSAPLDWFSFAADDSTQDSAWYVTVHG